MGRFFRKSSNDTQENSKDTQGREEALKAQEENTKLKEEINDLARERDKLVSQNTELTETNQKLTKEKTELTEKNKALTTEKENLNNQLNASQKRVKELEQSQQALRNENTELSKDKDNLTKADTELKKERDKLNNQLNASQKQVQALEQSQQALKNEKAELSKDKDNLTKEKTDLTEKNKVLITEKENLEQKHAPYKKLEKLYEVFLEVKGCLNFNFVEKTHSAMDLIAYVLSDSKYYLESLYNKASQELSDKKSDKGEKLAELFDLLFEYIKDKKFERLKEPSAYDSTCKSLYPGQNTSQKMQRVVLIGYTYDKKTYYTIVDMGS
ncbi:hypothetical protein JT092_04160 [Helicobacter pylori]|nr:hypothetical protein [Helicobacter pylori]